MEWFIAVVVIAALGVAALAAVGGLGQMSKDPVRDTYRQDLPPADQPLMAADIQTLRFGLSLRGYAMGQVDDVLDRLAAEIAARDAIIARLQSGLEQTDPETEPRPTPHQVSPE
jgi:DivIVA domain-containing protein